MTDHRAVEERSRQERRDAIRKLIAADTILTAGIAANRALSRHEETPPPAPPPVRLIPTVPVPEEPGRPGGWIASAASPGEGRVR